ncbi:U-box domain-containing protein 16 [Amaranthus tricolor]|uniref:U-box domain-containing protein 16 n=1 Tax=Amaranthus tricolor TaxID=29722 RepID=UPI0025837903|nr:U-box domain-containing protein 16 [Amaranthus tricolor]
MAVSPTIFPQRRRRPSPTSFLSPQFSTIDLLRSLYLISSDISSLDPPRFLFKRNSSSIIRKCSILSMIFEDVLRQVNDLRFLSPSSLLCFEEMFIILQRIRTLIEDCSNDGSKLWLLMQIEPISGTFHELTLDLWTLLEILPEKELNLSEDVDELRNLVIKQCREDKSFVDPNENWLRCEVLSMLDSIKKEIVPNHLRLVELFSKLGMSDSASCRDEIEWLEDEIQCQNDEKSKSDVVSLIGLVKYTKCVLYGASSSNSSSFSDENYQIRRNYSSDMNIPADFRCPITLDLMSDPVVVATGQTYDRTSIVLWIESGHNTCPKTGQTLAHTNLISNRALKSLIAMWCREHRIPYTAAENSEGINGVLLNKAAFEATKMTISFLLGKLGSGLLPAVMVNWVVYELRVFAKTDSDSRACIGEAGAIPLLVRYLGSEYPKLQINAVTTILNLSILEANKDRIMEIDGALNGVIEVLRTGATWEAKANAAATIFSLCGVSAYRKRLGKKTRVIKGLLELAREGPTSSSRDALVAILALAGDRDTAGRLVEGGVVDMVKDVMGNLPEEAVTILETVVKKGGYVAIVAASHLIGRLVATLRNGTDRTKESAIATLVIICRKGGGDFVAELARITTIEMVIWELMGTGTARTKRKAASLMRILRRWAAGLEGDILEEFSMTVALQ